MISRRLGILAVASALAMVAPSASAEATPTVWMRARSKTLAREQAALLTMDHEFAQQKKTHELEPSLELPEDVEKMHQLRALQALDDAGARRSNDPMVLSAVGKLLHDIGSDSVNLAMVEESVKYLRRVAKSDAPAVVRNEAYGNIATSLARLGKLDEEIASYESALALEPIGSERAALLANQAEAYMVKGDITRAIEGYRASIASLGSAELPLGSTTFWSLGVALDRSGDLEGALTSIARARSYDPVDKRLQPPGWFFVPPYDASWYAALGELLVARTAKSAPGELGFGPPHDLWIRKAAYEQCISDFTDYIAQAGDSDHYVFIARARLALVQKEAKAFEKKVGQLKKPEDPSSIRQLHDPH